MPTNENLDPLRGRVCKVLRFFKLRLPALGGEHHDLGRLIVARAHHALGRVARDIGVRRLGSANQLDVLPQCRVRPESDESAHDEHAICQ
jgi:hypothetical protein